MTNEQYQKWLNEIANQEYKTTNHTIIQNAIKQLYE